MPENLERFFGPAQLRCSYCGGEDHAFEACPKIVGANRRDPDAFVLD